MELPEYKRYNFGDYELQVHPMGKHAKMLPGSIEKRWFVNVSKKSDSSFNVAISADLVGNQFYRNSIRVMNEGQLLPIVMHMIVGAVLGDFPETLCGAIINVLSRRPNWPRYELQRAEEKCAASQLQLLAAEKALADARDTLVRVCRQGEDELGKILKEFETRLAEVEKLKLVGMQLVAEAHQLKGAIDLSLPAK